MGKITKVCIVGKLRSGKDSVGEHLVENYGFKRYAFGDALKADFHRRYPEIPYEPKPRVGYQAHGQLMRELVDADIWLNRCFDNINANEKGSVVITDCRQLNELTRCRTESYVIIRVTAPESVRIDRAIKSSDTFNLRDLTHDTESHVEGFDVDFDVVNSGTLAELYAQIDEIMTRLTTEGVTVNA